MKDKTLVESLPKISNEIISRIDFLDFMRIFAFLSVLAGHRFYPQLAEQAYDLGNHITIIYIAQGLMPLCFEGAAGVVVFFFVSGYIITHVLQKETTVEFLIKRVFRIYPLFISAVFVEAFFGLMVHEIALPPISVLIPRLLLMGDFFGTPYSLGGVEWTLRVEIVFYVFMAVLKSTGFLNRPQWLPIIFVLCTILLQMVQPFPISPEITKGYFTLYAPFLFVGSLIYLAEHQMSNGKYCIVSIVLIFFAFFVLIAEIQPRWKESNYAIYAFLLFCGVWGFRNYFVGGPIIRFLSNLTYSVYLFHLWLWSYLETIIQNIGLTNIPKEMQILFALLVFCHIAHLTVENYGITLGRYVLARYRKIVT